MLKVNQRSPMSIMENVLFGARFHGVCPNTDRASYARQFLEKVGLWEEVKDRLHERASKLSGGQQQRPVLPIPVNHPIVHGCIT